MATVTVEAIDKAFGATRVLKSVSLEIADGEFVALVGPSGCGKSTLLRIIAGLETQDRGHVSIGGRIVDPLRASVRNLAMVFQSYALYPHLTVAENIAIPLRMRRLTPWQRTPLVGRLLPGARARVRAIDAAVAEAAAMLHIDHLLERKPYQLSGGQRQRVALGRALVREPEAFLLDEPLSNLDAKLRVHTRTEIAELHRRLGATFIYVTHDQVEAMTMADRIAVMLDGEILQVATPDEVYNDPSDLRVAEFIGSPRMNVLPGEVASDGAIAVLGTALALRTAPRARQVRVGVRPEALRVAPPPGTAAPIRGRVRHVENLGCEVFAQVEVDTLAERVVVRLDLATGRGLRIGQPMALDFCPGRAVVFDGDGRRAPAWPTGEAADRIQALG